MLQNVDVSPVVWRDNTYAIVHNARDVGLAEKDTGNLLNGQPGHIVNQLLFSLLVGLQARIALEVAISA